MTLGYLTSPLSCNERDNLQFIVGVPFNTKYSSELIEKALPNLFNRDNYVRTSTNGDIIHGLQLFVLCNKTSISVIDDENLITNNGEVVLSAFVYLNKSKMYREDKKFTNTLNDIKAQILEKPDLANNKYKSFVKDNLEITFSDVNKTKILNIKTKDEIVDRQNLEKSCSILLYNTKLSVKECYFRYVKKDPVEKSFHNYKSHLGLDRPYIRGSKRMVNKTFIILIAQIIYCSIHHRMHETDTFKKMTMEKLFIDSKR